MLGITLRRAGDSIRILGLRLALPLLFRRATLPELMARLDQARVRPTGAADLLRLVERLMRPLRFWRTTCLWRSMAGYAALRAAGADVRLLIGVRVGEGGDLIAHAWLEQAGRPSLGAPAPEAGYHVAYAWPADPAQARRVPTEVGMAGLSPHTEVVLTELRDGTGVLLHLGTKFYFTLNRTGVLAWNLLAEGGAADAAALSARLAKRFPTVAEGDLRRDVEALLADLVREGLVTQAG